MIRFQIIARINGRNESIHCETEAAAREVSRLLNKAGHSAQAWHGLNKLPDSWHYVLLPDKSKLKP